MSFKFRETFEKLLSFLYLMKIFSVFCSFLGLDFLGYDSVFLYMSSLRAAIPFRIWHK